MLGNLLLPTAIWLGGFLLVRYLCARAKIKFVGPLVFFLSLLVWFIAVLFLFSGKVQDQTKEACTHCCINAGLGDRALAGCIGGCVAAARWQGIVPIDVRLGCSDFVFFTRTSSASMPLERSTH